MTKQEFLDTLSKELETLSQKDIKQYAEYYSEMIDDIVEDGSSEEEAVANIGTPHDIAAQIINEINPATTKTSAPKESRKLKVWEIILIAVGSPVWFSLLVAAFAVAIALSATLFAVIVAFYAATLAIGVSAVASIPCAIYLFATGNTAAGVFILGSGLICAGLSIFAFIGTNKLTKQILKLIKSIFARIKSPIKRKENTK